MLLGAFYLLNSWALPYQETGNGAYTQTVILTDQLIDVGLSPKLVPESLTDENPMGRYAEYRDLIRTLPPMNSMREELRIKNEELLIRRLANRQREYLGELERRAFYLLFFFGSCFTLVGLWWWYTAFQRYQDELIYLSAIEARQRVLQNLPKCNT
ncbi:hypothetical protein SAMN05216358_3894 [Rhizobium sp. AN5]|uniref:hypothetical protein n=1 Tax=Rhizobium sp. AN5 TaxID=1855304 RepID=UPI000BD436C3|nr:hypothetical protein [Rhizobium sp. AN5]SOC93706.1 hypothetical protein SAMN05216358_3894 [Rhizobium sp. AN5]